MLSDLDRDEEVLTALVAALTGTRKVAPPVVGQSIERHHKLAVVALRRMRSFKRRGVPIDDRARLICDLAKGLADAFEADPRLVGRLIEDYRFIAGELLDAYRAVGGS
jgi:hypothetical protein